MLLLPNVLRAETATRARASRTCGRPWPNDEAPRLLRGSGLGRLTRRSRVRPPWQTSAAKAIPSTAADTGRSSSAAGTPQGRRERPGILVLGGTDCAAPMPITAFGMSNNMASTLTERSWSYLHTAGGIRHPLYGAPGQATFRIPSDILFVAASAARAEISDKRRVPCRTVLMLSRASSACIPKNSCGVRQRARVPDRLMLSSRTFLVVSIH